MRARAAANRKEASPEDLGEVFASIASTERRIDCRGLQTALAIKSDYLAQRIFAIFDRESLGYLNEQTFTRAVEKLVHGDNDARLEFAFRLHDADGDGALSKSDVIDFIKASRAENRLSFRSERVEELLVDLLFSRTAGADEKVSFDTFKRVLQNHPGVDEQLTLGAVSWLQPKRESRADKRRLLSFSPQEWQRYIENNRAKLFFVAAYAALNVALFAEAFIRYAHAGANLYVQIARGCGACLNLNGALILLPMLRHALTWLRRTGVRHFIPLNQSISFIG